MSLKRRGVRKHTWVPVTWAVECPVHLGETHIEFPVGRTAVGASNQAYASLFYCPQGSGHNFNLEDAVATVYDDAGNVVASGVALADFLQWP